MYKFSLGILSTLLMFQGFSQSTSFKTSTVDTFYGNPVFDPYRTLEDTGNAKVKKWMKEQSDKTAAIFASIPGRKVLFDQMTEAFKNSKTEEINQVKYWKEKFYVTKRLPQDDYFMLYEIDLKGTSKLLIDPVSGHPGIKSKNIHLNGVEFSPNSPTMLYGLTIGGYETDPKIVMRNMITGKETSDTAYMKTGRAIISFDPENPNAFYYEVLPFFKKPGVDPTRWFDSSTIHHHIIGSDSSTDKVVIDYNPAKLKRKLDEYVFIKMEKNLPYVFAMVKNQVSDEYRISFVSKEEFKGPQTTWKQISDFDDKISEYTMKDHYLYLLTTKNAPNSKLLRMDLRNPVLANSVELIPNSKKLLRSIDATKNELLVTALDAGEGKLFSIPHGTVKINELRLPLPGNVNMIWNDRDEANFIIAITSWISPKEYYDFDPVTRKFNPSVIQAYHDVSKAPLEVKIVKVKSHDGVEVPMTIIFKKGLKLDGTHPINLRGYGAYGFNDDPFFWPEDFIWFNMGGIRAIAHVRGGGVNGEEWYLAGKKNTKPNTWKDFIACAEYLIKNNYASKKTLVASGGSAGGITVGRAITERPDLFSGAIIGVGLLDAVRVETQPNGKGNIPEFGSVTTKEGFDGLYKMSSYHHVKDGVKYPAVLFSHGVNDTRVPVWMSMKMAARLQEATASGKPVMLRLDYDGGHGAQETISSIIRKGADNYAFYFWMAGLKGYQPEKK